MNRSDSQNVDALARAIEAFDGAAEEAGISTEEELAALVREARAEMWAEREGHAIDFATAGTAR